MIDAILIAMIVVFFLAAAMLVRALGRVTADTADLADDDAGDDNAGDDVRGMRRPRRPSTGGRHERANDPGAR